MNLPTGFANETIIVWSIINWPPKLVLPNAWPIRVLLHTGVEYRIKLLPILQLVGAWPSILVGVDPQTISVRLNSGGWIV